MSYLQRTLERDLVIGKTRMVASMIVIIVTFGIGPHQMIFTINDTKLVSAIVLCAGLDGSRKEMTSCP